MQSDVPPLPISCLTDDISSHRNNNLKRRLGTHIRQNNSLYKSNCSTLLSSSRKQLHPLIAGSSPYKNSARFDPPDTTKSSCKSIIDQRVSSAKMLRIKQLQNQLADAHFHLNELSNENKLLKAIQKRQDAALKRYEGTNAELPRIINSHHEDLRVLQTKYKKLRSQYKETCETLKEKENELQSLQVQNKKLLQLSKDRHLLERDKLQMQVLDLNHRINQQDEIIQTLKRKLTLESKYLKHQLNVEMIKHRETQKQLQDTQYKLKSLEELTEQREKRSYHASRVIFFNKDRPAVTSQSLTNLNESKSENLLKGHSFRRRQSEAVTGQSLPVLNRPRSLTRSQSQETSQKLNHEVPTTVNDDIVNFEQSRHFRFQKSPVLHKSMPCSTSRGSVRDSPIKESQFEENDTKETSLVLDENCTSIEKTYELPKALKKEYGYESDNDNNEDDQIDNTEINTLDLMNGSRLLHSRLISSATEGIRVNKAQITNRSRSLTKENMEDVVESDKEIRYDRDSVVTVISRSMLKDDMDTNTNYSNSDLESEVEIPIAFNADEDENVMRESDIILDDKEIMEKQNNTSTNSFKLFNAFYKSSNYSFNPKEDNDNIKVNTKLNIDSIGDKIEFKSVNGLSVHTELITKNYEKSMDNLIAEKKSAFKEKPVKETWNDVYIKTVSKENENNSILSETSTANIEINRIETLSNGTIAEMIETKESEYNIKNYEFSDKNTHDQIENSIEKNSPEQKTVDENSKAFDKAKLLAAMKAIDNNDNIEFVDQKIRKNSAANRLQITENLYRGIPTHSKKKSDIMKELFADTKLDNNRSSKEN